MTTPIKFSSKLSTTRAGKRSRIWLQGKRLIAAGFKPGSKYAAIWTAATLQLSLRVEALAKVNAGEAQVRKVSGKGETPIIDIVGEQVVETFGKHCETVSVTYDDGLVTIRRGA